MIVLEDISLISNCLNTNQKGCQIGFVPTMGALHMGHLSLIEQSKSQNLFTVCSIYVNPTQFNDKNDLKNYPRNFKKDLELLKNTGCDMVFLPSDDQMYPVPDERIFDFGLMGSVMEAKHRPGHFNGVAQIVSKLFDLVDPDIAFFGQKDFQQLAIIKKLVADYQYKVRIIACPIVREADGMAMSSRNALLSPEQRAESPQIYKCLQTVKKNIRNKQFEVIKAEVTAEINQNPNLILEYFEIVNSLTLQSEYSFDERTPLTACIAVFAGKIRLIDNIDLSKPQ